MPHEIPTELDQAEILRQKAIAAFPYRVGDKPDVQHLDPRGGWCPNNFMEVSSVWGSVEIRGSQEYPHVDISAKGFVVCRRCGNDGIIFAGGNTNLKVELGG